MGVVLSSISKNSKQEMVKNKGKEKKVTWHTDGQNQNTTRKGERNFLVSPCTQRRCPISTVSPAKGNQLNPRYQITTMKTRKSRPKVKVGGDLENREITLCRA